MRISDWSSDGCSSDLMYDGKRSVAEGIVYGASDRVAKRTGGEPIRLFHDALGNVRPHLEVRSRRVGGATYQVPVEDRPERAQALAIRWLIDAARKRSENTRVERLSGALVDARAAARRVGTEWVGPCSFRW